MELVIGVGERYGGDQKRVLGLGKDGGYVCDG